MNIVSVIGMTSLDSTLHGSKTNFVNPRTDWRLLIILKTKLILSESRYYKDFQFFYTELNKKLLVGQSVTKFYKIKGLYCFF